MKETVFGFIPARIDSERLVRKALIEVGGKPLIQWTWERAKRAKQLDEVIIATDSEEIIEAAKKFGAKTVKTSQHNSGTDRIAEAVRSFAADIVINIQADEPLINPAVIDELTFLMKRDKSLVITTAAVKIDEREKVEEENIVKVVMDSNNFALYFSRSLIPYPRRRGFFYKHLGIYAYRRNFLLSFAAMPPSYLEKTEGLEQLRALEAGYKIKVVVTPYDSVGVDTKQDLEKFKALVESGSNG